jgi:hypothetical protein
VADDDFQTLRQALRRMPSPEPRAGFVERALARAAATVAWANRRYPSRSPAQLRDRWETWAGAALGGAVAAALTFVLLRTVDHADEPAAATRADAARSRNVDVLIDSERELKGATIRIAASGSIALDGFENEQPATGRPDLERGSNLLSLPVVARAAGKGRLVAIVDIEGRTQRVAVDSQFSSRRCRDHDDLRQHPLVRVAPCSDDARGRHACAVVALGSFTQRAPRSNHREKRDDLDVTMQIIVDPDAKLPDEVVRRIPLPTRKSAESLVRHRRCRNRQLGNLGNSANAATR